MPCLDLSHPGGQNKAMRTMKPIVRRIDDVKRRTLVGLVLTATALLLLSGCGAAAAGSSAPDTVATVDVTAVDCFAPSPDAPPAGQVPADFVPVAATLCNLNDIVVDSEGRWNTVTAETRSGSLDGLLSALAETDDGPSPACSAEYVPSPRLWLVDASGQAIQVRNPHDGCNRPKPGVLEAFEALNVTQTVTLERTLIEPRAAIDAGCPVGWKVPPAGLSLENATALPITPTDALQWCRYTTEPLAPGSSAAPEVDRIGTFAAGGVLDSATTARLYADVVAAETAAQAGSNPVESTCDAITDSFMVLWPAQAGVAQAALSVDLDGCMQLYRDGAEPLALSAELIQLLNAAQ